MKYIDNLLVVKKVQPVALRNKWLVKKRNPPLNAKTRMKKVANAKKSWLKS